MSILYRRSLTILFASLLAGIALLAQESDPILEAVKGKSAMPGYFTLYWDDATGRLWMEVDKWDTEFLYVNSLPGGVGSNDIGLDRGQLGQDRIVLFRKVGPKVLLIQPNYGYRAESDDPAERKAVEESFAQAVIWGFKAEQQAGDRVLIDITDFALRDAQGIAGRLRQLGEGEFKVDASRSAIFLDRTRSFPKNTEVEALLTFTTEREMGRRLQTVSPSTGEFTVRQHHSFVELPEPGYEPRPFDPRSGYGAVSYYDFATPIEASLRKRWIPRHRLQKKDPSSRVSEAVKPIVYYVDRGAPEPIRAALLDGARWWNQAFEAAGYLDAYRVELMPEGADPMDVRYNVIQWVHRSTRGWSYGASVGDPRTGEIIKGHVTLGSLRVRQDYLIATGLLAPYEEGKPVSPQMREMALARLRQLSAHEVGHTLGLSHNFAASVNARASVMDYPHPYVALGERDAIDLSQAYATGIGEWDKVAIAYGYQHFAPGTNESAALNSILDGAFASGLRYITDRDARPEGGASPEGHLWDNGPDPVAELNRLGAVRRAALNRFSEAVLPPGEPLSSLGETLVPIYLLHRYQVEAASKLVGGLDYAYTLRGAPSSATPATRLIPRERQTAALDALLRTIEPAYLTLPEALLRQIPPHPPGFGRNRESFPVRTGLTFDALAAAEVAADHTLSFLLHPERAARLVQNAAREPGQLGLDELIDLILGRTVQATPLTGMYAEVQRTTNAVLLYRLMVLAQSPASSEQVKAIAWLKLSELRQYLGRAGGPDTAWRAHLLWSAHRISRFQEDPKLLPLPKPQELPPGQPIGCGEDNWSDPPRW
ncbi:MAG: zinc-dependent metalloprotease [Bryobacterales bacterium]|nr:zinc-dependent metalloprotease [Bryobacterales bacterium]